MRVPVPAATWSVREPGSAVIIREGVFEGVRATVLGCHDDSLLLSIQLLEGPLVAAIHADCVTVEHPFLPGSARIEH